jgi:hypothetical protein
MVCISRRSVQSVFVPGNDAIPAVKQAVPASPVAELTKPSEKWSRTFEPSVRVYV